MSMESRVNEPVSRAQARAELLAASVLLIARLVSRPVSELWRDWVVLLSAYWIYTVLAGGSRHWPKVSTAVISFLLGIYAAGQLPHALRLLGGTP
jgi:hypothetical protein